MGQEGILKMGEVGIQLGFFYQFAVFGYILTAATGQANKEEVKQRLAGLSSVLQYLSFETLEAMLLQMKTLNLRPVQQEFLMLTLFHNKEFNAKIDNLEIELALKQRVKEQANAFMQTLFELAQFDPNDFEQEK
jgi:hypothetical protein